MKLKFRYIFTLLIFLTSQNFITAMEALDQLETKEKQEISKSKIEQAKEFIKKNPKTVIAIAAAILLAVGGVAVGVHKKITGKWFPWSPEPTVGANGGSSTSEISDKGPKLDPQSKKDYILEAIRNIVDSPRADGGDKNIIEDLHAIAENKKTIKLWSSSARKDKSVSVNEALKLDKIAAIAFRVGASNNEDQIQVIEYLIENPSKLDSSKEQAEQSKEGLVNIGAKQVRGEELNKIINEIKKLDSDIDGWKKGKRDVFFQRNKEYKDLSEAAQAERIKLERRKEYDEAQPLWDGFVQEASELQLDEIKKDIEDMMKVLSRDPYNVFIFGNAKFRAVDELQGLKTAYAFKLAKSKLNDIVQDRDAIKIVEYFMKNPSELTPAEASVDDAISTKQRSVKIGALRSESPAVLRLIINAIKETNVIGETK